MRILHKLLLLTASILGVSLVISLADFWRPTIRGIGFSQTIQWLIDEGYSPEEIAQHPEIARLPRGKIRFPPDIVPPPGPGDRTKADARFARALLAVLDRKMEESKISYAQGVADSIERELRSAPLTKKIAVQRTIFFALETLGEGGAPFTIENPLPASIRIRVEEAFGDDAGAVLTQIEDACSTFDTYTRIVESHGGFEGFVNHLVDVRFAPSAE